MNKRIVIITVFLLLAGIVGLEMKHHRDTRVFSETDVYYGATGGDVYELQGRLKFLGFYDGKVDGDYGWRTLKAVKWFQSEFGIDVDGVVGPATKLKLWNATKQWRPGAGETAAAAGGGGGGGGGGGNAAESAVPPSSRLGLSENDLNIMANAVFGESRGEPYVGQVAVAAVILNRTHSSEFPNSVTGVIFQPGAFTAVSDGQIWLTPNDTAKQAVRDALNGWDPSGGCLYYFNPATATSKWIWSRQQVKTIGKHIFCK
jgi:N-acetylmuramoyl-L-alanine amidase